MSAKELDPFNYKDIKPLNYQSKQQLISDLDDISKLLENTKNEWKDRENALKKLGSISKGNQGKSDFFIKYFNDKLCLNLDIQLSDLRSSVMKEACRITSLCASELGILIEAGMAHLLTQYVLFKTAGSANRVISDSSSKCILNIVRYICSIRIITNVCEQKNMKANSVRVICAQCLINIMSYYKSHLIMKTKEFLEETLKNLLVDANAEVRANARKAFIIYKSRFPEESNIIFNELGKNTQRQINEDEKNFTDDITPNIIYDDDKYIQNIDKEINEIINNNSSSYRNKPKTPDIIKNFNCKSNEINYNFDNMLKASNQQNEGNKNLINKNNGNKNKSYDIELNDEVIEVDENNYEEEENDEKNESGDKIFNIELKKHDSVSKGEPESISANFNYIANINKVKSIKTKNLNKNNNINNKNNAPCDIEKDSKNKNVDYINNDEDNNFNINEILSHSESNEINKVQLTKNIVTGSKTNKSSSTFTTGNSSNDNHSQSNSSSKGNINLSNKSKINPNYISLNQNSNNKKMNTMQKMNPKFEQINLDALENKRRMSKNHFDRKKSKSKEKFILDNDLNKRKIESKINTNTYSNNTNNIRSCKNNSNNSHSHIGSKNHNDGKKYGLSNCSLSKSFGSNHHIERININIEEEEISPKDKDNNYDINNYNDIKNSNSVNLINNNTNNINNNNFSFLNNNINIQQKKESIVFPNPNFNSNKIESNIFTKPTEEKIKILINKLDNIINPRDKLLIFQYLFNNFNEILLDVNKGSVSQSTLKSFIDIHIENLKEIDKSIIEQIIKNFMRMFFYMNQIFNIYEIESILKMLLFSVNNSEDKALVKLSNELLEIIRKKCDNEELFKTVYGLLRESNCDYENCFEFMTLLMPECDNILSNYNYFRQIFRLICLTDLNSIKVGKIIDILYRKYTNNFSLAYKEESDSNQKKILYFMEKSNSFFYREFKEECEQNKNTPNDNNKFPKDNYEHRNNMKNNNNDIDIDIDLILKEVEPKDNYSNKRENPQTIGNNNNLEINNNFNNKMNNKESISKSVNLNVINNYKSENICVNNIINNNTTINNNNNIRVKEPIPNEIQTSIVNENKELFLFYIDDHKSYIPDFFLIFSNKKYNDIKSIKTLLEFSKLLIKSNNYTIDLNPCMQLMIKQFIYLISIYKNNSSIIEILKGIFNDLPFNLSPEKFFTSITKYLTIENDIFLLEILLQNIKNYIISINENRNNKNKGDNELESYLDYFISDVFNLLNHQNSEIRKLAVYCCVEIYLAIGKKFEQYITKIPKTQQNLIHLFIKKRLEKK